MRFSVTHFSYITTYVLCLCLQHAITITVFTRYPCIYKSHVLLTEWNRFQQNVSKNQDADGICCSYMLLRNPRRQISSHLFFASYDSLLSLILCTEGKLNLVSYYSGQFSHQLRRLKLRFHRFYLSCNTVEVFLLIKIFII